MKRLLCALAIVFSLRAEQGLEDPFRLIPPDAAVVAGVDWKGFLASPAGQSVQQQFQQSLSSLSLPGLGGPGAMNWFGALIGQVDTVVFAMPQGAPADPKGGVPLLIIRGKFNIGELRKSTSKNAKPEVYRSVELFRSKGAESPFYRIAYPDVNTIVMGDRKYVHGAIDRWYQASAQPPSEVVQRARAIHRAGHFWLSANLSEELLKEASGNPAAAALAAEIQSIDGVITMHNGFGLAVHLGARSEESATKLLAVVRAAIAMSGPPKDAQSAEMMKKLQITQEESLVKLSLSLTQAELDQMVQSRMGPAPAAGGSRVAAAASRATSAAQAPPPTPKNATIKIYGLEEGPREIPLHPEEKRQ